MARQTDGGGFYNTFRIGKELFSCVREMMGNLKAIKLTLVYLFEAGGRKDITVV